MLLKQGRGKHFNLGGAQKFEGVEKAEDWTECLE